MLRRILVTLGAHGVVALLLLGLTVPAVQAQATPVPAAGGDQYTPLIQTVPTPPRWFPGSDGQVHLTYELLLTNGFPVPVTVSAVEVLDAASGAVIAQLEGDALISGRGAMPSTPTSNRAASPCRRETG
jgi:hypothetical protein